MLFGRKIQNQSHKLIKLAELFAELYQNFGQ